MEKHPESNRLVLAALALSLIIAATLAATFAHNRLDTGRKVEDPPARERLLELKKAETVIPGEAEKSVLYSGAVYDVEMGGGFSGPLPWAGSVPRGPSGSYAFSWRIRLVSPSVFSADTSGAGGGTFSLSLRDRTGAPVYAVTEDLAVPAQKVGLDPGIYVLDAVSSVPLDNFSVSLDPSPGPAPAPHDLGSVHLKIAAHDLRDLRRLVGVSSASTGGNIVKMAGGRVKADIVDGAGRTVAGARVGLSGRSREHLAWFPSVDLKLEGGTVGGIPEFKLYRLETKSGLLDFIFLSIFKDMGFLVPRQDVVRLYVNGKYLGLYILMETPSAAMFTSQNLPESNIIGVHTDKMFFDYPYGATLDEKYFYRVKGPGSVKRGRRYFLSEDFTSAIDADSFARFLAFASIYYSGHGLGVDDLRFYENPATGRFSPLPRDLNPGVWSGLDDMYKSYGSHLAWLKSPPLYTVWPLSGLHGHDYSFDRSGDLFAGAYETPLTTGVTDIHFAISGFVSESENLELANRYLRHFSANEAMSRKVASRVRNTLARVLDSEPGNHLLRDQLAKAEAGGVPFFGDFIGDNVGASPVYVSDGDRVYRWNLRSAAALDEDLSPSLLGPVRYGTDPGGWRVQLARAFWCEKRIFEILESSGLRLGGKTFGPADGGAGGAIGTDGAGVWEADSPAPAGASAAPDAPRDVATYLGTHRVGPDRAVVLFLVRNATEGARGFKVAMRDGVTVHEPVVNATFRLPGGAEGKAAGAAAASRIALGHFPPGETLRLLAFDFTLGREAAFYSVEVPEGGRSFFPPYMYLPARSAGAEGGPARVLPTGVIKTPGGYHIPGGSRVEVTGDLQFDEGARLSVGPGAVIVMGPGGSIKVAGDLVVEGTAGERVRFEGGPGGKWNGLYVEGTPANRARVVLRNVDFSGFGEFPKTRVGESYLNGGITFYNAGVVMDGVGVADAGGEDGLNLISSTALIKDVAITGARSDAIDLDFTSASIDGLRIEGSGGDGLDVSNSLVVVKGSTFTGSADKGVSVGEMSTIFIGDSTFKGNDMAIANKDQSRLVVSGSVFDGNRIALAEFIKKPYFARPVSTAEGNSYRGNEQDYAWLGLLRY